jgi:Ca2+:H+ antiporter
VRYLFTSWLDYLLIFVPATVALELFRADPVLIFVSAGLAIIPLAGLLGRATEHLTTHVGAGIGALLNASLGNAAELIIALVALRAGLHDVVKASLTGSILGNILLVLGVSMIPALFHFTAADRGVAIEHTLSLEISLVLFAIYIASLLFSLKTHRHLFAGENHDASDLGEQPWTRGASIAVLTVVTILVAVMSEMLVGALESASHQLGLTQVFVGVILVALVGNAAEHSTAVLVAMKNKMDLAYGIAVGSSLQIALLVAPLLVFASYFFGAPLDLIFTPFEVAAVTISVLIVGFVAMDGESNWMEGVMLIGVYLMLAIAFFFLPA